MIFSDLAAGQSVFIDSNVFVYHFDTPNSASQAVADFLDRVEK